MKKEPNLQHIPHSKFHLDPSATVFCQFGKKDVSIKRSTIPRTNLTVTSQVHLKHKAV